jgi:hypothetical protein
MWKKYGTAWRATGDNIIWHVFLVCCVPQATNTHSEYLLLTAFAQRQWLHKHSLVLTLYVRCLSCAVIFASVLHFSNSPSPSSLFGKIMCVFLSQNYVCVSFSNIQHVSYSVKNASYSVPCLCCYSSKGAQTRVTRSPAQPNFVQRCQTFWA